MPSELTVIERMQALTQQWEKESNPQAVFLSCYRLMASNMLLALEAGEFQECAWVRRLVLQFADCYFAALEEYKRDPQTAACVWQLTR